MAMLVAGMSGELICRYLRPLSTVEYAIDPDVGPILTPGQRSRWVNEDYDVVVVTNQAGFHDFERIPEKPPGSYRVVMLGDSYVEALQVPIDEGVTGRLELLLKSRARGKQVEVINLGVSGSGPAQYYRILEKKGLVYSPDLVIMAVYAENDFWDSDPDLSGAVFKPYYAVRSDDSLEYRPPQTQGIGSALRPWLRKSAFLHLVRQGIFSLPLERWLASFGLLAPAGGMQSVAVESSIPLGWSVYLREPPAGWLKVERLTLRLIRETHALAEHHGARFLVVMIGSVSAVEDRWKEALAQYPGAESLDWDFSRPASLLQMLGRQLEFDVIDLTKPFRADFLASSRSSAWPHDGHWNNRGHQLAAEIVSAHMQNHPEAYGLQ